MLVIKTLSRWSFIELILKANNYIFEAAGRTISNEHFRGLPDKSCLKLFNARGNPRYLNDALTRMA